MSSWRTTRPCLIKDGTANGATSNAYQTSSNVPFKTKCIIMKYRTGTLYNQKHVVLFKLSTSQTCPLSPQVDSALQILSSGSQHTQIRNMITERHNLACRMILKAISKTGSLGSCIVSKDRQLRTDDHAKSPDSETAESRIVPKWLFPPSFSDKDRFTSSRPDFVLVTDRKSVV